MGAYRVAPQTRIHLHQICFQQCIWIRSMGVFEMNNAKFLGFMVWRCKHAYLCTKYATSSVFRMPSMGVFEMHNAKKVVTAWRPKPTNLCTKYTTSSVFGYLV